MPLTKSSLPVHAALPRLFDDFLTRDFFDWGSQNNSFTNTSLPAVNIVENNEGFAVEMAAPGMNKTDFQIELHNEIPTISSQKEAHNELQENDRYTRREFSYQSFRRTFQLLKTVMDESIIKAQYVNGILRVLILKREEAKALPPRTINIQ